MCFDKLSMSGGFSKARYQAPLSLTLSKPAQSFAEGAALAVV
jgi:hypothetical protein